VYKAFDVVDGIEVAWNQVELGVGGGGGRLDAEQRERLFGEIRVLSQLRHRNVMSLFDWW
jgi:WNK lysine deficient protein kinase